MNKARQLTKKIYKSLLDSTSPWQTALLVAIASFAYFFRASQYLLKPQLFAEDGVLWLAEGHNKDFFAIFQPVNGFFHISERLFGYIVARLPLGLSPLIFVLAAWVLFILLTYYIFSNRTKIFTKNFERIFMMLCLSMMANVYELFFNFSNSVFFMGIIAALIMTARESRLIIVRVAEKLFFLLTCLTLPFSWFLVPIALIERFKYKQKNNFYLYVSIVGAVIQALRYVTTHVERSPVTLLSLFSHYTVLEVYNQMIVPALRFARIDTPIAEYSTHYFPLLNVYFWTVLVVVSTIVVIKRSNKRVIYLLFFLAAMSFASIKSPTISVELPEDALKTMAVVMGGSRYFVYGVLGVSIILVKTSYLVIAQKWRYFFMIAFLAFGLLTSLHYKTFFIEKNFDDYTVQYQEGIKKFNQGAPNIDIPVNPKPWHMLLSH